MPDFEHYDTDVRRVYVAADGSVGDAAHLLIVPADTFTTAEWDALTSAADPHVATLRALTAAETELTDGQARRIASEWHGGQWCPLYALASTGAIGNILRREIQREVAYHGHSELAALARYVAARPNRGPQDGWSAVWE